MKVWVNERSGDIIVDRERTWRRRRLRVDYYVNSARVVKCDNLKFWTFGAIPKRVKGSGWKLLVGDLEFQKEFKVVLLQNSDGRYAPVAVRKRLWPIETSITWEEYMAKLETVRAIYLLTGDWGITYAAFKSRSTLNRLLRRIVVNPELRPWKLEYVGKAAKLLTPAQASRIDQLIFLGRVMGPTGRE